MDDTTKYLTALQVRWIGDKYQLRQLACLNDLNILYDVSNLLNEAQIHLGKAVLEVSAKEN